MAGSHDHMLAAATAKTNILDLFEIGKDKANRATEIVFVERCLNLLKPGGRIGIVLPDGNLNNPSLTWLRRWCEGKARILAVVGLPEETFRSADATVKASLVFLIRFTRRIRRHGMRPGLRRMLPMTRRSTQDATRFAQRMAQGSCPATTRRPPKF